MTSSKRRKRGGRAARPGIWRCSATRRRAAGRCGTGRGVGGAPKDAVGQGAAPDSGAAPWAVLTGRYRWTGPEARMSSSKATGGLFWVHLPCDRAPTARTSTLNVPWPLIPAYLPVPPTSL
jgi:hypothetical protein